MANPRSFLFSITLLFHITFAIIISPTKSAPTFLDSICSNETNFLPNSSFEINLITLFLSLTSTAAITTNNFHAATAPTDHKAYNNTVYGLFLCRGDLNTSSCKDCVEAATKDLQRSYCPRRKVAIIWYNECMVRYSNESLFGKLKESPKLVISNSLNIKENDEKQFIEYLQHIMNDLALRVASDKSGKKFEIMKKLNFNGSQYLYILEQCTPDLSASDCIVCLKMAISLIPVSSSGRVLLPSCYVWYETFLSNFRTLPPTLTRKEQLAEKVFFMTALPLASISIAILALCLMTWKANKYNFIDQNVGEDLMSIESYRYDFATLEKATNYFSDENKLVDGFYGGYYKGKLGGREINVKYLNENYDKSVQKFKEDVSSHAKFLHRNLVEFIGFCLEREKRLLIYEHIPPPSLHYFLVDPERRKKLDWGTRFNIILGIARGMLYLDQDSRLKIIHCDLRPLNIFLDANMNAKISHFGLDIASDTNETGRTDTFFGSYGYMSIEKTLHKEFSVKSNVFCFGVLVLAIINSKGYSKLTNVYQRNFAENLINEAWKKWRNGEVLDFVDQSIKDPKYINDVLRCMHLGLLCIQGSPDDRPSMASVVFMLNNSTITELPPPEEPAFCFLSEAKSETSIITSASISELQAR